MGKINDQNVLFENLVDKYTNLIYKICFDVVEDKDEAFDMSQETFLSVYKHIKDISDLKDNEQKNYICKIALSKCRDNLKKNKDKSNVINIDDFYDLSSSDDTESIFELKDEKEQIIRVISNMKSPYKELLNMYYIEELTLSEIQTKLNTKKSVIKTQLARAKKILKCKMKERKLS